MPEVVVAICSLIGTLVGSLAGIMTANKLTIYRIEQLEEKVKKHNNLVERMIALDQSTKSAHHRLDELLVGPTAVVMNNEDYLEAAKTIYNFSKDNDFYKIKGGVIEGKVMSAEEIITLAKLPSKETLIGMLAGALLGNITKLAVALNEVKKQQETA